MRKHLEDLNITGYIPLHPRQEKSMVSKGGFNYQGDHLLCPEGNRLNRGGFYKKERIFRYVALQKDCQQCPIKAECLPPSRRWRHVSLIYHPVFLRAKERNEGKAYQREMLNRRTTVEGVFASLDRLGWARSRLRGLWKANCEGYISGLAHNLKKAVRRLGGFDGSPESLSVGEPVVAL